MELEGSIQHPLSELTPRRAIHYALSRGYHECGEKYLAYVSKQPGWLDLWLDPVVYSQTLLLQAVAHQRAELPPSPPSDNDSLPADPAIAGEQRSDSRSFR